MRGASSWRPERAGGAQRELAARCTDAHAVTGTHRGAFAHARTVHPRAVTAVIDEHRAIAFTTQRAVPTRHTSRGARQRDVRLVRDLFRADDDPDIREAHRVATE